MTDLAEQTWVVTGAAGRIATRLRPALAERVAALRLVDLVAPEVRHPGESAVTADLRDMAALAPVMAGAHGVLHLGGIATEGDFHDLAEVNIVGTFHVLESARRAGARRVVYASSNHATGFYATDTAVDVTMPPRPDSLYGVTKVAAEALGRMYADKFGLEVVSIRIGSFEEEPSEPRHLSTWLSPADCLRALLAAMSAPGVSYAVFYGVSRNTRRWWDLAAGEAVGYDPRDNAEEHAARLGSSAPGEPQGASFADAAYTLDRQEPDHA